MTGNSHEDRCESCGSLVSGYASVLYGSGDERQLLCMKCYNETVADFFGTEFEHKEFPPVILKDAGGKEHEFWFVPRLVGAMMVFDAIEVKGDEPDGYRFSITGKTEDGSLRLYMKLFDRVCRALGRKHIEWSDLGWQITDGNTVRGRIDWDPDNSASGPPLLVIDGKSLSWDEFGRMLMTYEGFNFRLEIFDRSEES